MNGLIYATTIDHALDLWAAFQLDVDWRSLARSDEPRLAVGGLDVVVPGAVARRDEKAYEIIGGVPVVRHEGSLAKYPTIGRLLGVAKRTRTYAEIAETLRAASSDRRAQTRPLLVLDTPGGAVDGYTEAVRAIRETEAEVFVERGTSGGTWLAAASPRVTVATPGMMGSVGVIHIPIDVSARLEREGVKPVPIVSDGAEVKAIGRDGSVDDEYVKKIKPHLNATVRQFQAAVREGRGLDDEQAAQVFTADVWIGADNVRLGLADAVADDPLQVIQTMSRTAASRRRSTVTVPGGQTMPDEDPNVSAAQTATAQADDVLNLEARLEAAEQRFVAQEAAYELRLQEEREAREDALAKLQAAETRREVDRLSALCADAPACLTANRNLSEFFASAIDGGWTVRAADGGEVCAAQYVADLVADAQGLAALSGAEREIADEDAPDESRRQASFEDGEEDVELSAADRKVDAAVELALKRAQAQTGATS